MNLAETRSHQPLVNIPKVKKPKKAPRKVSKAMAILKREYNKKVKEFLYKHPYCQIYMAEHGLTEDWVKYMNGRVHMNGQWTQVPYSSEVHHVKGRGKYLLDTNTWLAVSSIMHRWIHDNPGQAYLKGYMQPRR